jgi:dipeptidyl aminopeptidase/acylaminoacyl peptidase
VDTMFMTKLKVLCAALVAVAVLSACVITRAQDPPARAPNARGGAPGDRKPDEKDKPKPEVKPVVVSEKASINRLAWDAKGETVVTVGVTFEVAELTDFDGQNTRKVLLPSSTVKLWDAKTGELKRSLGEEKGIYVGNFALSPDRKTAIVTALKLTDENGKATGSSRGTEVRLMDAEKWELKRNVDSDGLEDLSSSGGFLVYAVAFSPDGKRLAMGGANGRVEGGCYLKLWDVQKEKLIGGTKVTKEPGVGSGLEEAVTSLAFSPDGKLLAAGCADGKLRLFDGRTGELKKVWDDDSARAWGVVFFPDGKTLVSQSRDKTVKVWDVQTTKVLRTLQGNKGWVQAAAFSPDGKLFATGGIVREEDKVTGGEVILWDAQTGELKHTLPDQTMPVSTLSFSPDGKTLAVAGGSGGYDIKNGEKTTGEIKLFPLESLKKAEPK